MVKLYRIISAIFSGVLPLISAAEPSITGTWVLSYVAPQDINNTMPRGVTNTKILFSPDGKLYSLEPEETSVQNSKAVLYAFDGKQIKLLDQGRHERSIQVSFPDNETMIFTQKYESQRTFKKISSFDIKLEPRSLELVTDGSGKEASVAYDEADYSAMPIVKRLRGLWEVIAYEKVPSHQMPTYGFFNDLWTITTDAVEINRREPPEKDSVPFSIVDGSIYSSGISLGASAGSKIEWTVSFNEWGHLVLDSTYCRVILKLIQKNTTHPPSVPLKVALLR